MKYAIAAQKAWVENEKNEVLLVRYQKIDRFPELKGYYGLPGGKVEIGDTIDESLKKEVFEETGISIEPREAIGIYEFRWSKDVHIVAVIKKSNLIEWNTESSSVRPIVSTPTTVDSTPRCFNEETVTRTRIGNSETDWLRSMHYEVDQSGKIEDTAKDTVLALSNDRHHTVLLSAKEKRLLQTLFRNILQKQRMFIYSTFAALVVLLLDDVRPRRKIMIDQEYPGKETIIHVLCDVMWRKKGSRRYQLEFGHVGKSSTVHGLAHKTYKGVLKPDRRVTSKEVIALVFPEHKKRSGIPLLAGPRALKRRLSTAGR